MSGPSSVSDMVHGSPPPRSALCRFSLNVSFTFHVTMPPCVEDSVHTPRSERAFEAFASSPLCDDVTQDVITAFGTSCSTNSKRLTICWDSVGSSLRKVK